MLSSTHELSCTLVTSDADSPESRDHSQVFFYHDLPCFNKLVFLKLVSGSLTTSFTADKVFEPHKMTLQTLHLSACKVTVSGLVAFVNYFTKLKHLALTEVRIIRSGDQKLEPNLFLRELSIANSGFCDRNIAHRDAFLNALFSGSVSWKEITIHEGIPMIFNVYPLAIARAVHLEVLDVRCLFRMYRDRSTILSRGYY